MNERERFAAWVREHHADLYRHAFWLLGDAVLAEEVVQETFFRAWRDRSRLRRRDDPRPWLLGILRHACFAEIARRGRSGDETPERGVADGGETVADLERAMARLRPDQRDLILLHALHGMSYQAMAEHLDIPVGTVMSRLARARGALRRLWDDDGTVLPFPRSKRRS